MFSLLIVVPNRNYSKYFTVRYKKIYKIHKELANRFYLTLDIGKMLFFYCLPFTAGGHDGMIAVKEKLGRITNLRKI